MSLLSVTYTFAPGGVIRASEHNQNMTDIVTWANGNINESNLDTLTGELEWAVTTNALAIDIVNTGTEGSLSIAHNATLASSKSAAKISSNAAQSAGTALLELSQASASANIPTLKITDAGGGSNPALWVVSTTKGSIAEPVMTTAQRDAISSPATGMSIWNSTLKRKEFYDGTYWRAPNSGEIVNIPSASLSLRPDVVACDGSVLANNGTNAFARAVLGTTYGATGTLPDARGRVAIGAGTGAGLTARTAGDSFGAEGLPAHTHAVTGTTASSGSHDHPLLLTVHRGDGSTASDPVGYSRDQVPDGTTFTHNVGSNGSHDHTMNFTSGSTGSGSHGVMQPSLVYTTCMVL